jgi:hypothetical protein
MSQYKITKRRLAEIIKEEYASIQARKSEERQEEAQRAANRDDDVKPDFLDLDTDGDKEEDMKGAAKDKKIKEESLNSIRALIQNELKSI